jgi:tRNA dimethylallyltransferase
VAGGTGLYLRALLRGLFAGPSRDDVLRQRLVRLAARFSDARLHGVLARLDPAAAARIHAADRVRIVRALEVYKLTGRPISEQQGAGSRPLEGYRTLVVGLAPDRDRLRAAVEARTRAMLGGGLVDETRRLLSAADERRPGEAPRPLAAIGYRQAVAVVRGTLGLAEAERAIVTETMRFAKRQMTWFRHQESVEWHASAQEAYERVLEWLDAPEAGEAGRKS